MINTFLEQQLIIQIMIIYTISWGLFAGVKGVVLRAYCVFSGRRVLQSNLGQLLTILWLTCIMILTMLYFGI